MSLSIAQGQFRIPMRVNFKHASAERSIACNPIVSVIDKQGIKGFGEACPRSYVSGETLESVSRFIDQQVEKILGNVSSVQDLRDWIQANESLVDANPSAFGAVELALLDLFGRQNDESLESLLGLAAAQTPLQYTAVVGGSGALKTRWQSWAYRLWGFRDYKIKLTGNARLDRARLDTLPGNATIRVDANNLWDNASNCIDSCRELGRSIWAIEEPVSAFDLDAMLEIAKALECKVILDESLLNRQHLDALPADEGARFIANIRVSKCGGILRSIALGNACQELGMGIIVGAHVAESSLLTRAAIAAGQGLADEPLAREGAYGTILLNRDLTARNLRFGRRGVLNPNDYPELQHAGTGLDVETQRVIWSNYAR